MADEKSDLLSGYAAIAKHLGITVRQAKHRALCGHFPTFHQGRIVCARKSALARHFERCEAAENPAVKPEDRANV